MCARSSRAGTSRSGEILRRVEGLKPDAGLIVIAPFLPSPLIELLGSKGFDSRIERGEGASWIVYLWRGSE